MHLNIATTLTLSRCTISTSSIWNVLPRLHALSKYGNSSSMVWIRALTEILGLIQSKYLQFRLNYITSCRNIRRKFLLDHILQILTKPFLLLSSYIIDSTEAVIVWKTAALIISISIAEIIWVIAYNRFLIRYELYYRGAGEYSYFIDSIN